MEKIIDWLTEKFSSPLSLLFFILGVLLLLLGLSKEIPFLEKSLSPAVEYRWVALIAGGISLSLALFIYYNPPKKKSDNKEEVEHTIPNELPTSFFARKALVSKSQKDLLERIEKHGSILITDLQNEMGRMGSKELFYRLEQLRLMGFIERNKVGNPNTNVQPQIYTLSEKYRTEIKEKIGHLNRDTSTNKFSPKNLRSRK